MRYLFLAGLLLFCSCDQLRGPKGDQGDRGFAGTDGAKGKDGTNGTDGQSTLLSTKVYTGTPTANPFSLSVPEITAAGNQVVQVYIIPPSSILKYAMPFTDSANLHYYSVGTQYIGIASVGLGGNPSPTVALNDLAWGQCTYRVEIRTFATASAAMAYMKNKDTINYLLGTE